MTYAQKIALNNDGNNVLQVFSLVPTTGRFEQVGEVELDHHLVFLVDRKYEKDVETQLDREYPHRTFEFIY